MANGHDGGVGGMRQRISGAHYVSFKLQPLSRLSPTAPLAQGSYGAVRRRKRAQKSTKPPAGQRGEHLLC